MLSPTWRSSESVRSTRQRLPIIIVTHPAGWHEMPGGLRGVRITGGRSSRRTDTLVLVVVSCRLTDRFIGVPRGGPSPFPFRVCVVRAMRACRVQLQVMACWHAPATVPLPSPSLLHGAGHDYFVERGLACIRSHPHNSKAFGCSKKNQKRLLQKKSVNGTAWYNKVTDMFSRKKKILMKRSSPLSFIFFSQFT